jgi:cell division transport system permease protein
MAGILLGIILIFAAIFIISNTIKITLYARKQELEIMQLVGATHFFIKVPFVLEGSFQGLLGAGLAVSTLFLFYHMAMERLLQVFSMPAFPFLSWPVILAILGGGMLLGAGGSLISMGRFLES